MIDDKKIEEAASLHRFELIASMHGSTLGTPMQCFEEEVDAETDLIENSFITGAKWAINEFLKDLWHPASEEPRDGSYFDLSCPKDGLVYCLVDIDEIKPVSLTPEILEKNGWKKFKRPYSSDYCYRRKGYPTLNIRSEKEVYFHWGDHNKSITAVHQLQHLLFGLGLNSEMEV